MITGCKPTVTADTTPPKEVTELSATGGNGKVTLRWKNPADEDLHQVEITANPADGSLKNPVYLAAAKGSAGSFIAEGLKVATKYTFTLKTIDKSLNKSAGVQSKPEQTQAGGTVMSIALTQNPAPETWTKEDVTVTVTSSTSIKEAKQMKGAKSASEVLEKGKAITGNSFEVTENGMYSVAVLDNDGRREVETIEIKNIDKEPPQKPLNFTAEYKLSAEKIILRWVDPADTGSGVKELYLTYTVNGANPTTKTIAAGTQTFAVPNVKVQNPAKSYAFTLKVVDKADNKGETATVNITPPSWRRLRA